MAHNRKYVPGGVALVLGRLRNTNYAMVQDEIEDIIITSHFLDTAPFKWIGLIYRYGLKNDLIPKYGRINKKYGDLPIAVELKMEILQWADQHDIELLREIFMIGALEALIHVGKKYKLPVDTFIEIRKQYGIIPESIEECQDRMSLPEDSIDRPGVSESLPSSSSTAHEESDTANQTVEEEIEEDDQVALIIEYKLESDWGSDEDLQKRYALEDRLEEMLELKNLGYCDGGSIGSGTMEVCCYVDDFEKAKKVIEDDLKGTEFADYMRIYGEDA